MKYLLTIMLMFPALVCKAEKGKECFLMTITSNSHKFTTSDIGIEKISTFEIKGETAKVLKESGQSDAVNVDRLSVIDRNKWVAVNILGLKIVKPKSIRFTEQKDYNLIGPNNKSPIDVRIDEHKLFNDGFFIIITKSYISMKEGLDDHEIDIRKKIIINGNPSYLLGYVSAIMGGKKNYSLLIDKGSYFYNVTVSINDSIKGHEYDYMALKILLNITMQ